MPQIFVDTAAWIALLNADDSLHTRAWEILKELRRENARLVTTEFVLLEVADALSSPLFRSQTVTFINGLREHPLLHIVPLSESLLTAGWELYSRRLDKEWSLTDCTSFVVMQEYSIARAFTSDHHFEQAGFVRLLCP